VQSILPNKNTGELHNLLGQIEEKDEKYIAAANEFETAAHLDPARTTSSIGEASCFSTEPMNRPSKSSRKRPGVIRALPG